MSIAIRRLILAAVLLLPLFEVSPALAGGNDLPAKIDVEAIDAACSQKAKPFWDTGVGAKMGEGSYYYRTCMKQALIENWKSFGAGYSQQEFAQALEELETSYITIIQLIHQGNRDCPCGTQFNFIGSSMAGSLFKDMLQTMAERANRYR